MLIAAILVFSPVYKYDSIGALRHTNPIMEKCEENRGGERECTGRESGQWSMGENGRGNCWPEEIMVTQKDKTEMKKRWEGM